MVAVVVVETVLVEVVDDDDTVEVVVSVFVVEVEVVVCEFRNSRILLFPLSETQRLPEASKARSSGS